MTIKERLFFRLELVVGDLYASETETFSVLFADSFSMDGVKAGVAHLLEEIGYLEYDQNDVNRLAKHATGHMFIASLKTLDGRTKSVKAQIIATPEQFFIE